MLNWWNDLIPLTEAEKELLNYTFSLKERDNSSLKYLSTEYCTVSDTEYNLLEDEFFTKMPFCNCNSTNRCISFSNSGTFFIDCLFKKYADDDTLVISSDAEHPSVKKNLDLVKNKLILTIKDDIFNYKFEKIKKEIQKYKKVFVYIIGTQSLGGEITPQSFYLKLKSLLLENRKDFKIVLDDVQAMFFVPRDYSIFDYVIGTTHATVSNFDLGILISKEYEFGEKGYDWGKNFLKRLDILLKRKRKLNIFKTIFIQYFNKQIKDNYIYNAVYSVPYIFGMENKWQISDELAEGLSHLNISMNSISKHKYLSMRAHGFITRPEKFIKVLPFLKAISENKSSLEIEAIGKDIIKNG